MVTLPALPPAVVGGALLVFALSIDDYVVTSFVAGVGATTLPLQIYSMVKSGVSPEINAVSTMLMVATGLLLHRGVPARAGPLAAGGSDAGWRSDSAVLAAPFVLVGGQAPAGRVLNLFIWSNYIAPETIAKFEARHGVKVNVDLYDSNEALLAKLQAGNAGYDVVCPSDYSLQVLRAQNLLRRLDHAALPHLRNLDPVFLDRPYDPGNAHSVPYFWGTTGIAYSRSAWPEPSSSWGALCDQRYRGRILMLDDAREAFGAALKWRGHSLNTTDPLLLAAARTTCCASSRSCAPTTPRTSRTCCSSGDVWIAQGWNGQFAKAMEQDPDIVYVLPKEGSTLFIDNLAIPGGRARLALAHAFIDFTIEAEIAAEICRTHEVLHHQPRSPAAAARGDAQNPAMFPPPEVWAGWS